MSRKSDHLNKFSKHITEPKSQGASQAMFYGKGLMTEAGMKKAEADIQLVISGYSFIKYSAKHP